MPSIVLFRTNEATTVLQDQEYFLVLDADSLVQGKPDCWLVEYGLEGVERPGAEPIVFGTRPNDSSREVRILWRDAVWRPATYKELAGMKRLVDTLCPTP